MTAMTIPSARCDWLVCDWQVRREIAIMKKLSHANVTNLIEIIDDPDGKHLYMILE